MSLPKQLSEPGETREEVWEATSVELWNNMMKGIYWYFATIKKNVIINFS